MWSCRLDWKTSQAAAFMTAWRRYSWNDGRNKKKARKGACLKHQKFRPSTGNNGGRNYAYIPWQSAVQACCRPGYSSCWTPEFSSFPSRCKVRSDNYPPAPTRPIQLAIQDLTPVTHATETRAADRHDTQAIYHSSILRHGRREWVANAPPKFEPVWKFSSVRKTISSKNPKFGAENPAFLGQLRGKIGILTTNIQPIIINYLLTFATLPHTRLLNIILKHFFYSALATDFRFYHTAF